MPLRGVTPRKTQAARADGFRCARCRQFTPWRRLAAFDPAYVCTWGLHHGRRGVEMARANIAPGGGRSIVSHADPRETALSALPKLSGWRADDRDNWLRVGMSLHATSPDLLDAWDSWSNPPN